MKALWIFLILGPAAAEAFPTSTVWIPSDQVAESRMWRWDSQVFFTLDKRLSDTGVQQPFIDEGVTYGVFNNDAVAAELGLDWWEPESQDNLKCLHGHFKLAVLEGASMPSIAFGVYNFGFKSNTTDENIIYGEIGKTFKSVGHFFLGFFTGNENILEDDAGNSSSKGFLIGFTRPLTALSPKLNLIVDWQGSYSQRGAFNFGFKWALHQDVWLLAGYDIYNNRRLSRDTATVQLSVGL